jgi:hypothetical protein
MPDDGEIMVIALVGRRIDAPDTDRPVFPLASVDVVRQRVCDLLKHEAATALVCSAACGADLLSLEAAGDLGIRRRVVLPFDPGRFREISVVDRPGDWGPLFDKVIAEVTAKGDLVNLKLDSEADESYVRANRTILHEALNLAGSRHDSVCAVLVWNCVSRGESDITSAFGDAARSLGWRVLEVSTL